MPETSVFAFRFKECGAQTVDALRESLLGGDPGEFCIEALTTILVSHRLAKNCVEALDFTAATRAVLMGQEILHFADEVFASGLLDGDTTITDDLSDVPLSDRSSDWLWGWQR